MGTLDIGNAEASNLAGAIADYSVDSETLDSPSDQKETYYINQDWEQWLGFYKNIPELNTVINAKAVWTVGKGFKTEDEQTEMILDEIKGFGKDTFNTIIENMIRTMYIGGDAFAEIIKDKEDNLINLKPLNPRDIRIVANKQGIIIRYEKMRLGKGKREVETNFEPHEILHFAKNRIGDEIHGSALVPVLANIILTRNEAIDDYKTVLHRFVKPRWIIKLDTDDTTKIAAFKAKMDKANDGENMYIPKDSVELEQMTIAPNSTLNPQTWIDSQNNYFYEAAGVPKIIVGGSGEFTEASAKIAYLTFQQGVEEEQLYIEEQILNQLNLLIELEFPASLENDLLSDNNKDGAVNVQPNETTAGSGQ